MVAPKKREFTEAEKASMEKVLGLLPMKEPFRLSPWAVVEDPLIFHRRLVEDIKAGPEGPRAVLGTLHTEVSLYLKARA